jgi:hypothetical protein
MCLFQAVHESIHVWMRLFKALHVPIHVWMRLFTSSPHQARIPVRPELNATAIAHHAIQALSVFFLEEHNVHRTRHPPTIEPLGTEKECGINPGHGQLAWENRAERVRRQGSQLQRQIALLLDVWKSEIRSNRRLVGQPFGGDELRFASHKLFKARYIHRRALLLARTADALQEGVDCRGAVPG